MRLDKLLSSQGLATRKQAKELARKGLLLVNGVAIKDTSFTVDPEQDEILVEGNPVQYKKHLYLMMNKPQGVVCATEDGRYPTVLDLVPDQFQRRGLFPAGRLDVDTEGFVLITDDGDFAHRILSPKQHISKTYHAKLEHSITAEDIVAFQDGVILEDGYTCMSAELQTLKDDDEVWVSVVICEGKYHQIKRMFEARRNRVIALRRVKMGLLALDENLPLGECREILHKELQCILGSNYS